MKRIAAVMALLALLAATAYAANNGLEKGFPPEHGLMNIPKLAEELGLSQEQKRQVAVILKENRDKARALHEEMKAAREQMGELMMKAPGDEKAIRGVAGKMARAGEELAVHAGKMKAAVDGVLTAEQKAKLAAKKDEFKHRFKERFEKHRNSLDSWIDEQLKG